MNPTRTRNVDLKLTAMMNFIQGAVHAQTPLRLGLAGGGTDVAPYSDVYGGHVINATISLFTHCEIKKIDGHEVHFEASDFDVRDVMGLPGRGAANDSASLVLHRAVYRRIVKQFLGGQAPALSVLTYSDAPPGSGVGSSSALVVCMVKAYSELFDLALGEYEVARLAYEIERVDCGLSGGKQDQYAASFGGFNHMQFNAPDSAIVNPMRLKRDVINTLSSHLLLYYTGRSRESARIIEQQIAATQEGQGKALEAMHQIRADALEMKNLLMRGQIRPALELIGRSWLAKRQSAQGISNAHIDSIAQAAIDAGAIGLKVSGAGGGGFMMIATEPAQRQKVMRALASFEGRFYDFHFVSEGAEAWGVT